MDPINRAENSLQLSLTVSCLFLNRCLPTEVTAIDDTVSIKQVKCGYDGTMFLTDTGALLACGRFVAVMCGLFFFNFHIHSLKIFNVKCNILHKFPAVFFHIIFYGAKQ